MAKFLAGAVLAFSTAVSAQNEVYKLQWIGTFESPPEAFDTDRAEHLAYDKEGKRLIIAGADAGILTVLDINDPTTPVLDGFIPAVQDAIDMLDTPFESVQSTTVIRGVAVGAIVAIPETNAGVMGLWDLEDFNWITSVPTGPQPEGIAAWDSPDGTYSLVACVNEGSTDYDDDGNPEDGIDPEGSITIMRLEGFGSDASVVFSMTIPFDASVGTTEQLLAKDVRLTGANADKPPLDLEPERAAFHPDGSKLFVNLQDNSAVGVLDVESLSWDFVDGYGFPPQMYDASDEDGAINIMNWGTFGSHMPDVADVAVINGKTYFFTADEGSGRDYEEARLGDVASTCSDDVKEDASLGRLKIITSFPTQKNSEGELICETITSFGGRSFSIFEVTESGIIPIFNSMSSTETDIESIISGTNPKFFNSQDDEPNFDNRSDDKGSEPEALRVGQFDGKTLVFVGLERIGGIFVYDVTDPENPTFQDYLNRRHFGNEDGPFLDIGPEDIVFIPAEDSPICRPMISVANAISGSVTNYAIELGAPRVGDGHLETPGDFGEFTTPPLLSDISDCPAGSLVSRLEWVGTYETMSFGNDAAENLAIDPVTGRYVVIASADEGVLRYVTLDEPTTPTLVAEVPVSQNLDLVGDGNFNGDSVQSVVATKGVICAAVVGEEGDAPGRIIIYDGATYGPLASIETGIKPEGMSVSADGAYVASANEGEVVYGDNGQVLVDPPGSVTVVKLEGEGSSISVVESFTVGFEKLSAQDALAAGLRLVEPSPNDPSLDLEPEATAFTPDGKYLVVNFQDNNGLAVLDLETKEWVSFAGYGTKIMTMDASDRCDDDCTSADVDIKDFTNDGATIFGLYQPDAIDVGALGDGSYYVVTANEGDARTLPGDGDTEDEDVRLEDIGTTCAENDDLIDETVLGRLQVTSLLPGEFDSSGKAICEAIYAFGGRSFSVFKLTPGADTPLELLYDSDDLLETKIFETNPNFFNADEDDNDIKSRSDAKGPEPEILKLATLNNGKTVLFLGLERIGGVMLFDMTNPSQPVFNDYVNRRNFGADLGEESLDSSPEGIVFVPASASVICADMIVVANAVSGTVTAYRVIQGSPRTGDGHCCEGNSCPAGEQPCSTYSSPPSEGAVSQCDVIIGQSCAASCGFKALTGSCFCDNDCTVFSDCCPNYTELCAEADCGSLLLGDVTGDGDINVLDVVATVNLILSELPESVCQ